MKLITTFLVLFVLSVVPSAAQDASNTGDVPSWNVDRAHSSIGFKVRHLGIATVSGHFNAYEATFVLDPSDVTTLSAQAKVDVASIDTENERRDNHLRSDDFFDAENHPELTFVTTSVRAIGDNRFELTGDLTMRGTTNEVVLEGEISDVVQQRGSMRVAIEAEGRLNRFDYGLRWDNLTEAGGLVVGEEVRLVLELSAVMQ